MSEELVVRQCAPTLAGIKTGSLFSCPCDSPEELRQEVRRINRLLAGKGLCLLPLRFDGSRALLYLYRPSRLRQDLEDTEAVRLLEEAGYEVHGLHLSLLKGLPLPEGHVPDDGADAGAVARMLGLPFHDVDLSECFRQTVVDYFIREYEAGRTPNPCVFCNRTIKFGAMWDAAQALGANCLATGHYANIARDAATGRYLLRRGADRAKDQSYFLCRLKSEAKRS